MTAPASREERRRLTLELSHGRIAHLDALRREWGLRSRGDVLERLLDDLFPPEHEGLFAREASEAEGPAQEQELDEQAALVLVGGGALERMESGTAQPEESAAAAEASAGGSRQGGGIDLPGFVRRRSKALQRSLAQKEATVTASTPSPLPRLAAALAEESLAAARQHWLGLYGSEANTAVLEAAMTWLAQDIWPQAEPVEGRAFTWSAACGLMQELVEGWSQDPACFERVIVTAGVLEDPFSAATLGMRIPTLIHRFVQRFRRRPKGTSFQTLEHTMTLQGALRLLELPTQLGQRVTLAQIREAYREQALRHHPDAGGSVEAMRRLNEAYQLLKELYRQPSAHASSPPATGPAAATATVARPPAAD